MTFCSMYVIFSVLGLFLWRRRAHSGLNVLLQANLLLRVEINAFITFYFLFSAKINY